MLGNENTYPKLRMSDMALKNQDSLDKTTKASSLHYRIDPLGQNIV
jgi:hypothetical protein